MGEPLELIIRKAQEGDQILMNALLTKFHPLLKKQAKKLRYDDAYNDLVLDFLGILRSIDLRKMRSSSDGSLVSYIQKAVLHSYYKRQSKNKIYSEIPFSNLTEREARQVENEAFSTHSFAFIELAQSSTELSETEKEVLELMFQYGNSIAEIALLRGVSRQAVNQIKNRAINKLKKLYRE